MQFLSSYSYHNIIFLIQDFDEGSPRGVNAELQLRNKWVRIRVVLLCSLSDWYALERYETSVSSQE